MTTVRCPHCGTANRAGSNFCNHCGVTLRDEENPNAPPAPPSLNAGSPGDVPTPAAHAAANEWSAEQPWLHPEASAAEEADQPLLAEEATPAARRLVGNVQGLLDPLRLFSSDDLAEQDEIRRLPLPAPLPLDGAQTRRLREFLTTAPLLHELAIAVQSQRWPSLRIPWLFWLLGLAVGLPLILALPGPLGAPRLWPGVTEAYLTLQDLPAGSPILLLWAYDPASAGEMDLLAEPLIIHLLERQLEPVVVTFLPNGAATARRLFQQARQRWFASRNLQLRPTDAPPPDVHFLTGGPAALALMGQNLGVGLTGQLAAPEFAAARAARAASALTVVVAADAGAVQRGLEQLQPLGQTPLVAFTSAGADPVLRPYLDTGQLRGLVSGFDGAYAYQALRTQSGSDNPGPDLSRQVIAQNWGHLALLLIILLGNLAALLGRFNRG